jgi:hypothetical protein
LLLRFSRFRGDEKIKENAKDPGFASGLRRECKNVGSKNY